MDLKVVRRNPVSLSTSFDSVLDLFSEPCTGTTKSDDERVVWSYILMPDWCLKLSDGALINA
jgi:hypothetical protein